MPLEDPPLVSVVMPFKDAAPFLGEAARSVLGQTWPGLELLLVDDGGTDGSDVIAQALVATDDRVRVISHEKRANRGIGPSRALGIRNALGRLVAFLDADDVWEPCHLTDDVGLLVAHPEADFVCGRVWMWRSWCDPVTPDTLSSLAFAHGAVIPGAQLLAAVLRNGGLATATNALLARRQILGEALESLDRFPGMYEDQVMNSSLQLRGTAVMSGSASAWYRQHPMSFSAQGAVHAEPHDEGRSAFLTWLAGELAGFEAVDPEVWRLHDLAQQQLRRDLSTPPGTARLAAIRPLVPDVLRRAVRVVRRRTETRSTATAGQTHLLRLEILLFRWGADVRGDVLLLGDPAGASSTCGMTSLEARPWLPLSGPVGPRHGWADLRSAAYDCVLALPDDGGPPLDAGDLRHLRRALRPAGVLLLPGRPQDRRILAGTIREVFGVDEVIIDSESAGRPGALLLYRSAIPAC